MFVIYESNYKGTGEILICVTDDEQQLVREYFTEGGRDLDDYDRSTMEGSEYCLRIKSEMRVSREIPCSVDDDDTGLLIEVTP